jgi:hypothetical protein
MAKKFFSVINISDGRVAPLDDGGNYAAPTEMGGLQTATSEVELAEASLYGDGVSLDKVSAISAVNIEETTAGESNEFIALVNGHTVTGGEMDVNAEDAPPMLGHGYIGQARQGDENSVTQGYIGVFYPKMKFAPVSTEYTAKTDSVTYSTTTLSGTGFADANGSFFKTKVFTGASARADALAWLDEKFGVTA